MINDQDLGFISNFLSIFIPLLVIAYHYVIADLKCEGSWKDQAGTIIWTLFFPIIPFIFLA